MQHYRLCSRCGHNTPTPGGIELKPGRWYCASCWIKYLAGKAAA